MTKQLQISDIEDITYSPNEAVKSALEIIGNIHEESTKPNADLGVFFGLPDVDTVMFPGRPGHVMAVLGRTNHGKSQVMQWWARKQANFIRERQAAGLSRQDECVVYVTWEQAVEEMVCFDLAQSAKIPARDVMLGTITDEQMADLRLIHGPRRIVTPIYLIGHSVKEGKARPLLTLTAVRDGLLSITEKYGLKIRALFLDHLQEMTPERGQNKEEQTRLNASRLKDIAFELRCTVIVGTQAKRESYQRMWLPQVDDSEWSSALEHTCDALFGIWYPCRATGLELGDLVTHGKETMEVTKNLFILGLLKQRWGDAGKWWPLHIEPETNTIGQMTRVEVNDWK